MMKKQSWWHDLHRFFYSKVPKSDNVACTSVQFWDNLILYNAVAGEEILIVQSCTELYQLKPIEISRLTLEYLWTGLHYSLLICLRLGIFFLNSFLSEIHSMGDYTKLFLLIRMPEIVDCQLFLTENYSQKLFGNVSQTAYREPCFQKSHTYFACYWSNEKWEANNIFQIYFSTLGGVIALFHVLPLHCMVFGCFEKLSCGMYIAV